MEKTEAQDIINTGKARGNLKKAVQKDTDKDWFIVLGRFQAAGNDESGWTPLAIHKMSLTQADGSATMQSSGRVIDDFSAKDVGYIHMTPPHCGNFGGVWVWDAD